MRRLLAALGAAFVIAAVLPGLAAAADVYVSNGVLHFQGAPGEHNAVKIATDSDFIVVTDTGALITHGPGCFNGVPSHTVACDPTAATSAAADLGDQDDSLAVDPAFPLPAQLRGGNGNDVLRGGNQGESLFGDAGNDTLDGRAGSDLMVGGVGRDSADYSTRTGAVTVTLAGADDDGGPGEHDNVAGDVEVALGGSGDDELTGNANVNSLVGGAGNDELQGRGGADVLNGGTGLDTVSYFDRTETVNVTLDGVANDGAPGENDKIIGVSGIIGGRGDDVLTGDAGPNGLFGGPGNDTVSGLDGTDQLEGGHGHDTVVGGPGGHDVATYEDANTHVDVSLDGVANDGGPGELDQVAPSVEDVSGTIFADHLAGNAGPNRLRGGGEGDTLEGLGGADDLQGGTGADVILAGDGSDLVHGDEGADVALLGAGNDAFVHPGGDGSDSIEGQDGSDTMRFDGTAFDDINEMTANGARLRFAGNGEIMDVNDVETVDYRALTGSDVLSVHDLSGTDVRTTRMDAGAGDARTDIVGVHGTGGADKPAVTFGAAGVQVNGLASRVLIAGTEGPNDHLSVQAGAGNDLITARAGLGALINLRVEGGLDEDTVLAQGTGAAETFDVTNGGTFSLIHDAGGVLSALTENLRVDGSGGDDVINGSSGLAASGVHLRLDGGAGNDKINGGDGEDFLIGGIGNDEVDGKAGADVAILGAGADAFSWLPGDGDDTVEGGADGDRVAFSGSVASESVKLAANGPRVSLTRDVGPVALDLAGVETIDYRALGGADVFTVGDVAGTGLKAANADLAAVGGGGDAQADRVVVIGTAAVDHLAVAGGAATGVHVTGLTAAVGVTHAEAANDELRINTLAGNDTVDTSAFAPGAIGLFIDGDPA